MRRYPPRGIEIILAQIWLLLARAHGGEKAKGLSVYTVAPWLEAPEERRAREENEEIIATEAVAAAWIAKQREREDAGTT